MIHPRTWRTSRLALAVAGAAITSVALFAGGSIAQADPPPAYPFQGIGGYGYSSFGSINLIPNFTVVVGPTAGPGVMITNPVTHQAFTFSTKGAGVFTLTFSATSITVSGAANTDVTLARGAKSVTQTIKYVLPTTQGNGQKPPTAYGAGAPANTVFALGQFPS